MRIFVAHERGRKICKRCKMGTDRFSGNFAAKLIALWRAGWWGVGMRCAFLAHWTEHSGWGVTRFSRAHTYVGKRKYGKEGEGC